MVRMIKATPTNRPATFPVYVKNPLELLSGKAFDVGGEDGVMVKVRRTPVTVITDVTGIGDQEETAAATVGARLGVIVVD